MSYPHFKLIHRSRHSRNFNY